MELANLFCSNTWAMLKTTASFTLHPSILQPLWFQQHRCLIYFKKQQNHIANLGFQQLSTLPNIQDGFIITSHGTYLTAHYVFAGEESMAVVNVISVPLKNVANKRGKPIDTEALEALFTEEVKPNDLY